MTTNLTTSRPRWELADILHRFQSRYEAKHFVTRHQCQTITKERWLAARKSELLPVPYFHKVFTIPHELNRLTRCNKKVMLNILFSSVSETLKEFGRNPRNRLGGTVGFTLILHTWNQKLLDHFHLHCVIAGGALSPDEKKWIAAKNPDYLFFSRGPR